MKLNWVKRLIENQEYVGSIPTISVFLGDVLDNAPGFEPG